MTKKNILAILLCAFMSSFIFIVGYDKASNPEELYKVYLDGKEIGYIEDKGEFEDFIDEAQQELKEKYSVDKVYAPNNIYITKEITYGKKSSSAESIYNKIKDIAPFTIDGYIITIKGYDEVSEEGGNITTPDKTIYVLDKEVFNESIKNTVFAFVSEADYNNFINDTQTEIKDTGTIIEDIYIKNKITIKEGKISTEGQIFTNVDDLSQYLIFGSTMEQEKYTVKSGDTISDIAYNNKLSIGEFLIANPELTSENNLLYEGQIVNLGLIDPQISLIEEEHVVELQTKKYDTKIEYDANLLAGYERVTQNGENGLYRVTKKVQKTNGEIESAIITNTEIIKPSVSKIIVRGSKVVPTVGNLGIWAWPTAKPYIITSSYGWRWGKFHHGIDISGTGYGSPIYAANNGIVETASYTNMNGNYIIINHNNGYYTVYAHMASLNVTKGQAVSMGQKIGTMGATGYAYGTHLHFSIYKGRAWGESISPLSVYQ